MWHASDRKSVHRPKRRYPYYHCASCGAVRVRKERLETAFVALLERLQPNAAYMRLFREGVLDSWKDRQVGVTRLRTATERRIAKLGQKLERLEEAFIYRPGCRPDDI